MKAEVQKRVELAKKVIKKYALAKFKWTIA
jgi:hypothetical protein